MCNFLIWQKMFEDVVSDKNIKKYFVFFYSPWTFNGEMKKEFVALMLAKWLRRSICYINKVSLIEKARAAELSDGFPSLVHFFPHWLHTFSLGPEPCWSWTSAVIYRFQFAFYLWWNNHIHKKYWWIGKS